MEKSTWISFSEAELLDSGMSRSTSMELPSLQVSSCTKERERDQNKMISLDIGRQSR